MKKERNKKFSIFQMTAIILTVLLILLSIILVGIIIHRNNQIAELKEKNDKIANTSIVYSIDL